MTSAFGFVMVRYVNSAESNLFWQSSCLTIRKHYPNHKILIIDDNSDQQHLSEVGFDMTDCMVVRGEFPRRGELLGYYYFYKLKPFEKAVVIHDNMFFNQKLDFGCVNRIQFLWSFDHTYDDPMFEMQLLKALDDSVSSVYADGSRWLGCYGVMSVISWSFVEEMNTRLDFFTSLLPIVSSRDHRKALERVFACACFALEPTLLTSPAFIGDIHEYRWGRNISFAQYLQGFNSDMPVVKILTGR